MRVLVACEFSGTVRDALRARGIDAWSCDLEPSEKPMHHIQGDVLKVLNWGWDMMIAFPPCTYLTNSANRWLKEPGRMEKRAEALDFVRALLNAPIERIALENPVGAISTAIRKPDQKIQPWQFGHGEVKGTCFWLKNLPPLEPTIIVEGRKPRVHWEAPGADRWKNRSRTYQGVAEAMAEQWCG